MLTAANGREALAIFEREHGTPNVLVLDVVMPAMGANDLLRVIRLRAPGLKVLLTNGYTEAEARRLSAECPGAAFIQKPYTTEQTATAVEELLRAPRRE